jgi:hypothetical protein
MAETRKRLRHAGNSSDSLAKDNTPVNVHHHPTYMPVISGLAGFSFLILIGRFATLNA